MCAVYVGQRLVWGVPEIIQEIDRGDIDGKMRLRFRSDDVGRAYFKTDRGIRCFLIGIADDGHWFVSHQFEQGRNLRK